MPEIDFTGIPKKGIDFSGIPKVEEGDDFARQYTDEQLGISRDEEVVEEKPFSPEFPNEFLQVKSNADPKRLENANTDMETIYAMTGEKMPLSAVYQGSEQLDKAQEDTWGQIAKKSGMSALYSAPTAIGGVIRAGEELVAVPEDLRKILDTTIEGYEGPLPIETEVGRQTAEYWDKKLKEQTIQPGDNKYKRYGGLIVQNAAANLPILGLGFLTGGSTLPLAIFGTQAGGIKYQQLRDQGISPKEALHLSGVVGLSEAATEKLPTELLIKAGVPFAKRLLLGAALDVPGELINTSVEAVVDKVSITPDMTLDSYIHALAETAIVSLGTAGLLTTITHPLTWSREQRDKTNQKKERFQSAKLKGLTEGQSTEEANLSALEAVAETPEDKKHVQTLREIQEAPEEITKTAEEAGSFVIGSEHDEEGVAVSFTIADPETLETITVDAKATEGEIKAELNKLREPEEIAPEEITEERFTEIIEGTEDIEAISQEIFGEKIEERSATEIIKNINETIGEKGAIGGKEEAKITPLLVELGNSIWRQGATTFEAFKSDLQKITGETWDKIKHLALKTWESVKRFNEKLGEVGAVGKDIGAVKNIQQLAKSLGGINYNKEHMQGELDKLKEDVPAMKFVVNKKDKGVTLDGLLEAAIEAGILNETADINDLLNALEKNLQTPEAIEAEVAKEERAVQRLQEKEFTNEELRGKFLEASKKARQAFKEGKKAGVEKQKAIMRESISKLETRHEEKFTKVKTDKDILSNRRNIVNNIQNEFGLTDTEVKKMVKKDPRLMTNYEFKLFKESMKFQALEVKENKEAKLALIKTIKDLRLQKVDNYRKALELPAFSEMTTEQLTEFDELMQTFEEEDIFLTQRELETVDRTDTLKGIRTWREAKEQLAKEIGVPVEELTAIKVEGLDVFRWDSSLREKNPFYNLLVGQVTESMLNAETRFHDVESKVFELAKKSEKSRKRTLKERAIPQDEQIFEYLEANDDDKAFLADDMTPEQVDYAEYIKGYFETALRYLVETKSLEKGRENYFTHMRRTYLESVRDDGLLKATLNMFKNYQQDQMVFNILDDDTGNILPLEKFFQFSLQRTGGLEPSKNITKVFLNYVKTFERKTSFDSIIPKMDIYAQSLTPQKLTPRGLEMDRSLKKYVNKYINNKKGRRISYDSVIKQGGEIDLGMNSIRTLVTMMDLGFSIPVGVASFLGEQLATTTMLGVGNYTKGVKRMNTKKGKEFLKKYEVYTGRSFFEEYGAPGKQITERLSDAMFGLFHLSTVTANKQFLLGTITDAEWKAGELSSERLAELKLEMGRFRPIPGTASIVGSTSPGKIMTQYKTWAVPIVRTLSKDIGILVKDLKKKPTGEALTTREAKEIYRAVSLTAVTVIVLSMASGDIDDDGVMGKTLTKLRREALTLLQGFSPAFWLGVPRVAKWLEQLGKNVDAILKLEEYKTRPGLKGVEGLKRQFTPGSLKVLISDKGK